MLAKISPCQSRRVIGPDGWCCSGAPLPKPLSVPIAHWRSRYFINQLTKRKFRSHHTNNKNNKRTTKTKLQTELSNFKELKKEIKSFDATSLRTKVDFPERDPEKEKVYNTLKDTFDAFDKDGSAEMAYEEYRESWKFLNRPGSELDIRAAFDAGKYFRFRLKDVCF